MKTFGIIKAEDLQEKTKMFVRTDEEGEEEIKKRMDDTEWHQGKQWTGNQDPKNNC